MAGYEYRERWGVSDRFLVKRKMNSRGGYLTIYFLILRKVVFHWYPVATFYFHFVADGSAAGGGPPHVYVGVMNIPVKGQIDEQMQRSHRRRKEAKRLW